MGSLVLWVLLGFGTGNSPDPGTGVRNVPRPELQGLRIEEHLGDTVPNVRFRDEQGTPQTLRTYIGDRPLILIPAYYRCKNLCPMVLRGVVEGLRGLNLRPGKDYRLLTVSFDPQDDLERTRQAAKTYRQALIPPEAWRFVPGEDTAAVRALLRAVGYPVRPVKNGMFAHVAAVVVLTPDLRISRYLYGVTFRPRDLRLALLEAGQGKIGTVVDRVLLYCYRYDPSTGGYGVVAFRLMQVVGGLTLLFLGAFLGLLWLGERKRYDQRRV